MYTVQPNLKPEPALPECKQFRTKKAAIAYSIKQTTPQCGEPFGIGNKIILWDKGTSFGEVVDGKLELY